MKESPMSNPNYKTLERVSAYLLDMDGTVYLDGHLLNGAKTFLQLLDAHHIQHLFLTNNSSRSAGEYADKLRAMGIPASQQDILTSGDATANYLRQIMPGARLFVVGTRSLQFIFRSQGFVHTQNKPDAVVLGFDTSLTYAKLWRLCNLVRAGLPYYATHPDINCPTLTGYMPDIGAMISFVKASTGREPDLIIGKPNYTMVESAARILNLPVESLAVVGDRLYTDIAMGKAANLPAVLVLSGETKREDLHDTIYQPDYVFKDLGEFAGCLEEFYSTGNTP